MSSDLVMSDGDSQVEDLLQSLSSLTSELERLVERTRAGTRLDSGDNIKAGDI